MPPCRTRQSDTNRDGVIDLVDVAPFVDGREVRLARHINADTLV